MKSILTYIKTHYIISSVAALAVIIVGGTVYAKSTSSPKITTVEAKRETIVQTVSVTGRVKPSSSADLAFEHAGKVAAIYADVGAHVTAGQTIVALVSSDLIADLNQAQAQLQKEQVKLADLKSGTRPEDIAIAQAQVDSAQASLNESKKSAINTMQDAYTKADDAVRYHVDKFFTNPRTSNPQLIFTTNNSVLINNIQSSRVVIETTLNTLSTNVSSVTVSDDIGTTFSDTKNRLQQIKSFLDTISIAVNSLTTNSSLSQTTIDSYKADMSAARTDISTAISNVTSAEASVKSAQSSLDVNQRQLDLKKAGSTQADINAEIAQVNQYASIVASKQAALAKNYLRAPIDGTVSKQEAKVGEIASAGTTIVSVISDNQFEIEANIPEADIAKVHVQDPAKVTLDAYSSDVSFDAKVVKIDPAETIIDGVPTYKVTFQFLKADNRIKSGMTANIDITSATKENVIGIPQRVVSTKDGKSYVSVKEGTQVIEKNIQTGLRGSNGDIEVVSGLDEGALVVISK